jgi:hypothetical protein
MKRLLFLLTVFIVVNNTYGQLTEIVVTSILKTDRTFHKGHELFLENNVTKNEIIYALDTLTKKLTTKSYLIETYYGVWDGDTIIKKKMKRRNKYWRHEISRSEWENILSATKTNIDSLQMDMGILHTSHHYMNIYIDIINNSDTITYSKTKPFEYLTPWRTTEATFLLLNPSIDIQIATHLPEKFIGRRELNHLLTAPKPK